MTRLIGPSRRGKSRRALFGAVSAVLLMLTFMPAAQAELNLDLFELDDDAGDDVTSTLLGTLGTQVANTTTTSINVCRTGAEPANGSVILIDAERMEIQGSAEGNFGGNCSGGEKRTYTVERGADGTPTSGHASGENVTLLDFDPVDGPDWSSVYEQVTLDGNNEGDDDKCIALSVALAYDVIECAFTHDGRAQSVFTQSKEYDEISDDGGATKFWQWRDQSVPDADELDDGFAAKIVDLATDDQYLFFGADRFATNGSKDAGFWFFHADVAIDPDDVVGDGSFTGLHTEPTAGGDGFCNPDEGGVGGPQSTPNCAKYDNNDSGGDLLILTTFTNGGAATTIRVYEWVGDLIGDGVGTTDALLLRSTEGDCEGASPTEDSVCATVNKTTVESGKTSEPYPGPESWFYDGKGEPQDRAISAGGLLEGGINLTDLGLEGCFSSYMATTRSAPSITADPKDFVLDTFEACDTDLTTTPKNGTGGALTADSDNDNLDEISIGTGTVSVKDSAVLNVKGTDTFTGTLAFYICGPIANPTACNDQGVNAGFASNPVTTNGTYTSNAVTLTSVGRYCWFATFTSGTDGVPNASDGTIESAGPPKSTGECFEVMPVTPALTTTAWSSGDSSGSAQTTPVDFGSPLYDKANLSGAATGPGSGGANATYPTINPTVPGTVGGTIEFTLKGPDTPATNGTPRVCSTTNAAKLAGTTGTNPETKTVTANGDYFTSGFTPASPGLYHWVAVYAPAAGDPNNIGSTHNADCSNASEDVTVRQIPTEIRTKQSWFPNDTAQIKSTISGDAILAGGTVDFFLYNNATCTPGTDDANLKYSERITLANSHITNGIAEVSTSNYPGSTGLKPGGGAVVPFSITTGYADAAASSTGSFSWKVVYTPAASDQVHTGKQSACTAGSTETFSITYTNDNSGGTNL